MNHENKTKRGRVRNEFTPHQSKEYSHPDGEWYLQTRQVDHRYPILFHSAVKELTLDNKGYELHREQIADKVFRAEAHIALLREFVHHIHVEV